MRRNRRRAFTLVEILVVIAIILMVTIVALPVLSPIVNGRQLNEAARLFTASLAGVKDAAIRANEPRGLRLLPDPTMTIPPLGSANAGSLQLCYNRMVPIELATDYAEGAVTIGPALPAGVNQPGFPPSYPRYVSSIDGSVSTYPFFPSPLVSANRVLMVEESPFTGGFITTGTPNNPTNWYWNIRLGDQIRISGSGRAYTVVGPCTVNPWKTGENSELFVNVGPPGTPSPLLRSYYTSTSTGLSVVTKNYPVEFLMVVDGQDNNVNGFDDEGWNGYDENGNGYIDEVSEWEPEAWQGTLASAVLTDASDGSGLSPSTSWLLGVGGKTGGAQTGVEDRSYAIERRPVPTPGAREVYFPNGVTIDATGIVGVASTATNERSRFPVESGSLYCDIVMLPTGQYVPTTAYSTPVSGSIFNCLHFWMTEKGDVYPEGTLWGMASATMPRPNPSTGQTFQLPMPKGTPGYTGSVFLENGRKLITYFPKTGLVTTNSIETNTVQTSPLLPAEGFNVNDVNQPFYNAELGAKEVAQ